MFLIFSFLLAFLSIIVSATGMSFQTIEKGHNSGIEDVLTEVYRTRQDFEAFWGRHGSATYPPPNAPDLDFASQMVAAVFTGTKRSGGYSIEVTSVEEDEESDELVVNFITGKPAPGAIVTMALTQPYHVISLEASNKNIVFMGSAKPNPLPKFILSLTKDGKSNMDAIVAQIEASPAVKNVQVLKSVSILFVDFDSESISADEARAFLHGIKGVGSVEEDQ